MPVLTDRQRIELAIPPYLLFALTGAPNVFVPATSELAAKAEQQIAELREDLRTACFEPFADLTPMKRRALLRRLERIKGQITAGWGDHSALDCPSSDDLGHSAVFRSGGSGPSGVRG